MGALGLGILIFVICYILNRNEFDKKKRIGWAALWGGLTVLLNIVL